MFFPVQIHPSASPVRQRALLHESLRTRVIHPRLHYESAEQTRKWLVLHRKYSPATNAADTGFIYNRAFTEIAAQFKPARGQRKISLGKGVQVISLGCGGGNKDVLLLRQFQKQGVAAHYIPCDISLGLVLEAAALAKKDAGAAQITPVLCDLTNAMDLSVLLNSKNFRGWPRIFLFFGMLPSMEPSGARACLRSLLATVGRVPSSPDGGRLSHGATSTPRRGTWPATKTKDRLVISANLFPASVSEAGKRRILSQYDNPETREWLFLFLRDLGVSPDAGKIRFEIRAPSSHSLPKRIEAGFQFRRAARISVDGKNHSFRRGDRISLFFSNRHTPILIRKFLSKLNVTSSSAWISASGEEGVFAGVVGVNE